MKKIDKNIKRYFKDSFYVNQEQLLNNTLLLNNEDGIWIKDFLLNQPSLNWDWLSKCTYFPWTADFINQYKEKLNWKKLSNNPSLPWSKEFIEQFQHLLDWIMLSKNSNFKWTEEMLVQFADKIHWAYTGKDEENYIQNEYIGDDIDYDIYKFYNDPAILWTPELFKKVKKSVENYFKKLEQTKDNSTYSAYWTFYQNTTNWSYEFLQYILEGKDEECSIESIDWYNLSRYGKHFWKDEFIKKYINRFNYNQLAHNPRFPWNIAYIELFDTYFKQHKEINEKEFWFYLSGNRALKLDMQLIKTFEEKWNWRELSRREDLNKDIIKIISQY